MYVCMQIHMHICIAMASHSKYTTRHEHWCGYEFKINADTYACTHIYIYMYMYDCTINPKHCCDIRGAK